MARIILRREGNSQEFKMSGVTSIGRQSTNDIVVLEEKASRQHARLIPTGRQYVLEDLGSSNGTLLNGVKVQRHALKNGDVIAIGQATLTYYEDDALNLEGTTLGNYRIHNKIGQGGMGAVYKATQISMDRVVALKVLKDELTNDRKFVKQFLLEARTAGKLNHPNAVKVHDFGEADGTYYFSMEYVDGESIDDILKREGKISVPRTLDIIGQMAAALDHAHGLGILHKDVKPQNILFDRRNVAKLTDLGLARSGERESVDRRKGSIMGTPHYMAPETAQMKKADARTDIYSLGATFFHMLTGRVPYEGANSLAVIAKHVTDPVPKPKHFDVTIPDPVCRLIERMMAKNPDIRPSSAQEVVNEVEELKAVKTSAVKLSPVQQRAGPAKVAPIAPRPVRVVKVETGSPTAYMAIGALVVGILGFAVWLMASGSGSTQTTRRRGGTGTYAANGGEHQNTVELPPMSVVQASRNLDSVELSLNQGDNANVVELLRDVMKRCDDETVRERAQRLWSRAEGSGGGGGNEQEAAAQLDAIRDQLKDNPQGKSYAARQLRLLISEHPATSAASEARRILRLMVGAREIPELDEWLKEDASARGTDGNVGGGSSEADIEREFNEARDLSMKAEGKRDFHSARSALSTFMDKHRGHNKARAAAEMRDQLDTRIRRILDRTFERAETLSRRGSYAQAGALLQEIIMQDPIGTIRVKAENLYESNQSAAEMIHEGALAAAEPHFEQFAFEEAASTLRTLARRVEGTEWEEDLKSRAETADRCDALLKRFALKLEAAKANPPEFTRKQGGRTVHLAMLSSSSDGITVQDGRVQRMVAWKSLSSQELVDVMSAPKLTAEDKLGLGALLLLRGERDMALQFLAQVRKIAMFRDPAMKLLAQVDDNMKAQSFDFSRLAQIDSWVLDGMWSVRGGKLIHEDSNVGVAKLKDVTYHANGFEMMLELTFLEDEGMFEVQLGADAERCLWFAIGSDGYEARCTIGSQSAVKRDTWKMRTGEKHLLACTIQGDTLIVSGDGKAMKELELPGMSQLAGPVTLRAQGLRLALDNIALRQAD
jgi:hypothetical protein